MAVSALNTISLGEQRLVVGLGALAVSDNPEVTLTTYSLGCCLGVTIYDPAMRAGGLLHAMLPDSSINAAKANQQPAMFVDKGVAALFRAADELKIEKHRAQICVAGWRPVFERRRIFEYRRTKNIIT